MLWYLLLQHLRLGHLIIEMYRAGWCLAAVSVLGRPAMHSCSCRLLNTGLRGCWLCSTGCRLLSLLHLLRMRLLACSQG